MTGAHEDDEAEGSEGIGHRAGNESRADPIRRRRAQGQTEFTLDTVLGTEEIGNDLRAVTPRYLLSEIANLREANRILMDHSTKRGVVFGRWAWSDEQEFTVLD